MKSKFKEERDNIDTVRERHFQ